jgi:tetratricopeptide (TPR) repeat protein
MDGAQALRDRSLDAPVYAEVRAAYNGPEAVATIARADQLVEGHRYAEAVDLLGGVSIPSAEAPELALRVLLVEAWAQMQLGNLSASVSILARARVLAEGPTFSDVDRAEAMFRFGCCRLKLGKPANAISLFTSALGLAEHGGALGEALQSRVFDWRSRAHQLQRAWDAAEVDAERSLELAQSIGDDRLAGKALMQCSLVAERRGDPMIGRLYAERARDHARRAGDVQTEARVLNNLGGLSFLLGETPTAVRYLKESFALSLELGNQADAAQVVSSLAQVHLRSGAPRLAEEQARYALEMLEDRDDYIDERGNAQLVLGRALLEQGRVPAALAEFTVAEGLFERLGSVSHRSAAWIAQADAERRNGDADAAMTLYRRAAEALQDFHF